MAIERIAKQEEKKTQNIFLENREGLNITGVRDVLGFSESTVSVDTVLGLLKITGSNLKIIKVSTDDGTLELVGKVSSLEYKNRHEKKSLWQSVFK